MTKIDFILIVCVVTLVGTGAAADQYPTSPNVGGKGPGMGHDYRRNIGEMRSRGGERQSDSEAKNTQSSSSADRQSSLRRTPQPVQPPGLGHPRPGYPDRDLYRSDQYPGFATPYPAPRYGEGQRRNRRGMGYGYPGYRGQGGSPYPRHRQYGNPPGIPRGPAYPRTGAGDRDSRESQ